MVNVQLDRCRRLSSSPSTHSSTWTSCHLHSWTADRELREACWRWREKGGLLALLALLALLCFVYRVDKDMSVTREFGGSEQ